jgi:hypothetical protein
LCRPQNFLRALRAGDVRARPHLAPFSERAGHPNLRPNPEDQWDADVEQPVRSKTKTVWRKHVDFNLARQSELSLCRREIRRRETLRVHLQQGAAASQPRKHSGSARPPLLEIRSNFQLFRKPRQNSATRFRNQNNIFQAHSTESGIIKPRLDREHLAIFQRHFL